MPGNARPPPPSSHSRPLLLPWAPCWGTQHAAIERHHPAGDRGRPCATGRAASRLAIATPLGELIGVRWLFVGMGLLSGAICLLGLLSPKIRSLGQPIAPTT